MIRFVSGICEYIDEKEIVVNNQGIGYAIIVPDSVTDSIGSTGKEVKIFTYLSVREDAIQLFGFLKRDELELFKMLIKVSGMGPKSAIALLSTLSASDIKFAIIAGDSKAIAKAPGIGAKTAGKVVLELKDRIDYIESVEDALGEGEVSSKKSKNEDDKSALIRREAAEALEALGYSPTDALKAIRSVDISEDMTTEELLRQSLKHISNI